MLKNILLSLKNFLMLSAVSLFCILILVKWKIYSIRRDIISIEYEIVKLKDEIEILDTELAYLTNPERLKKLYFEINKCVECYNILAINQIKNITDVLPFYYVKYGKNSNPMALNDSSK